jgi:hypothetical protein
MEYLYKGYDIIMSLVSDEETEAQKGFIEDGVRTRI